MNSHQKDVTQILAYFIQSCHDLVPPDEVLPVVKAIAYNFVTERCSNEVIAVGINSIREIIFRVPSLLREVGMDDFIQDLSMYSRKTHKSVMIAASSLINLTRYLFFSFVYMKLVFKFLFNIIMLYDNFFRDLYPKLLKKHDRGRNHNPNSVPNQYGDAKVFGGVEGAELLEAYERGEIILDNGF